jgi:anaerobic ribonucleoside-triphosphate reductase
MEGACGVRLKADDDVSEIFKNGRASISLGYIGIHETINALYGNQHMYDSEALREKGVARPFLKISETSSSAFSRTPQAPSI